MSSSAERTPALTLHVIPVTHHAWAHFAPHHYLSHSMSKAARCFIFVTDDGDAVAFASYLRLPHPKIKGGWRGHRIVVLPDYQGLGIGPRISDVLGEMVTRDGGRYYGRTAHPRLIAYRDRHPRWRLTSRGKNGQFGDKSNMSGAAWIVNENRETAGHEYLGGAPEMP